jgi:hypothetical protein
VAVLREARPLGRELLVKAARKKGGKARSDTARNWLAAMAADPTSGVVNSADGFDLADGVSGLLPDPDPAMTPDSGSYRGNGLPTPPLPHDPSLKGVRGVAGVTPDPGYGSDEDRAERLLQDHSDIAGGES